ncbi:hypothetical protein GFL09_04540 [Pseudomonas stutzeri]|uniref:Sel1 repeat family protein n=1 Tax=Stutzerimonas stutzeri KOS6 TaxID=1218352 RepID=A0A061JMK2_STUST|nr:hypothetical protein [Stutzerimonas stutzeri]EWC40967.1 hypothetical protein B597_012340 [Stutzerimonas stutzeri KOS6]MBK3866962.1 hypothetical protein [Stutzerimonas stutzeri]
MKKALLFGLLLTLGGCASQSCDRSWSDSCRAERLLYQNDLMQAKILISVGDEDGYELAQALLGRSAKLDRRGETEFYQAVLLIRQGPEPSEVLQLLEKAKQKGHPHAVALLYKIYQEPYLLSEADQQKAARYRQAYGQLDVARSGYPSFDKSLQLVDQLVAPPPPAAAYQAPCPQHCLEQSRR